MHRLVRTRSQHFVSSPRKAVTALKHKLTRHPSKRRRITIAAIESSDAASTASRDDSDEEPMAGPSNRERSVLSAETGEQTANQVNSRSKGKRKEKVTEKPVVKLANPTRASEKAAKDVFGSAEGSESSPRKRKRGDVEPPPTSTDGSGSWVEVTEDDEEPEFMADSDHFLLHDAPLYTLNRLRKAELIRLWKVAGMWEAEDDEEPMAEDDDDGGLGKRELIEGLIAARKDSSSHASASTSPRTSPKRKAALEASQEIKRLRSATAIIPGLSSASASSSDSRPLGLQQEIEATPKPTRKNRRARITDVALLRTLPKRTPGPGTAKVKNKTRRDNFRGRSKSMGGEGQDRKARFGDDVKSPGKGLIRVRTRRSSTLSSAYTTTDADASPDDSPITIRHTSERVKRPNMPRNYTPARRIFKHRVAFGHTPRRPSQEDEQADSSDGTDSDEDVEPTPLVARLRSRHSLVLPKEAQSEHEADAEAESEDEENTSPKSRRQLRSRDRNIDSDVVMPTPTKASRPSRGAKIRAIEAIKHVDSDGDETIATDVSSSIGAPNAEDEVVEDTEEDELMDEDDRPRSGPLTRSQLRAAVNQEGAFAPRHTRNFSGISFDSIDSAISEDDDIEVGSMASEDTPSEASTIMEEEMRAPESAAVTRTTRSGKPFGVWQSRKRRLRQEAIEDPDMEADEEEMEEDDEEEEEDEEQTFNDIDLSEATTSSLVRLLRDELVHMCEVRGLEVGGTKPQLARSLLAWYAEQQDGDVKSTTSSQATARPRSSKPRGKKVIHAVASNVHKSGQQTPVLLRDHIHVTDPQTPPHSDESKRGGDADLNLDLQELGLEDSMIKPEQLQKQERIGSGGFKDVYVGKLRGRKVAISEFRGHLSEMDIRELKLLAEFSHPNIVKFRGICIPEDSTQVPCMLVSELCENGDLFDYIRNVECPSYRVVLGLMLDIAKGLEYLHTRKPAIIHRDCKSSNILINRAGHAKVGDFGLARVKTSARSMIRSLVGTVNWQAPELWHPHPRYDYKVDVFSAGMVYWEMLSGWTGDTKYPWEGHNEHYIYDAVGNKHRRPSVAGLRKRWGNAVVDIMEKMWHQDPAERPNMSEVVVELERLFYAEPFTPLKNG